MQGRSYYRETAQPDAVDRRQQRRDYNFDRNERGAGSMPNIPMPSEQVFDRGRSPQRYNHYYDRSS